MTTTKVAASALFAVVPNVWLTISAVLPVRCMRVMMRLARAFTSPPAFPKTAIAASAVGRMESMK